LGDLDDPEHPLYQFEGSELRHLKMAVSDPRHTGEKFSLGDTESDMFHEGSPSPEGMTPRDSERLRAEGVMIFHKFQKSDNNIAHIPAKTEARSTYRARSGIIESTWDEDYQQLKFDWKKSVGNLDPIDDILETESTDSRMLNIKQSLTDFPSGILLQNPHVNTT
jgi:hypothetical protein